jgi:peptide/nickel transport system permease protein
LFVGRVVGGGDLRIECPAPCLGVSFRTKEPVLDIVKQTLPVTASIVLGAAVVYLTFGIGLGMLSAARRGTLFDRISVGTSLFFGSMQLFFLGPVLMLIFVWNLQVLPRPTYVSPFEDFGGWFMGLLLPWITLGLYNSAIYARLSRAQMLETLSEDFVRTARAKGLPTRRVYFKHAFRAAVTPIITIAGIDLGIQLGGVVITETTFSLSGLGKESATAALNNNLPVIMGAVIIAAIFIVIMNVFVDSLYAVIDPRVRLG